MVLGACLGDNYMNANGSSVIYSKGTTNQTGMHAYHAMMCVGYDNNRGGSNGAFRIVNSWGSAWGDKGFVWIDANYMCSNDFAYTGLVAYLDGDDSSGYGDSSSDVDLQPYKVTDEDYNETGDADAWDPRWRTLTYDVYNAGEGTVRASSTWGNAYVLYNAYNANEMTVVLVDVYTDQLGLGKNETNFNWDAAEAKATLGLDAQGYSLTNADIPGNTSVATYVTKLEDPSATGSQYYFSWTYKMPDITGSYYLVMISDAFSSVSEANENNNYYFLTNSDGSTWELNGGRISYKYNTKNAADDWAFTPGLKLEAGNLYHLSFTAYNTSLDEAVAGYVGREATPAAMTTELIAPTVITYEPRMHYLRGSFKPTETGVYYFAVKACSPADMSIVYVDDVAVTVTPATAPGKPENLLVTPGERGALSATIAFNAPSKAINGSTLASLDCCVVERDGTEIARITDVTPGQAISVSDTEGVSQDTHTYKIYSIAGGVTDETTARASTSITLS